MDSVLKILGILGYLAITLGFWAFVLLFHVLCDWKSSPMGRHIMSMFGTCALILTWSLVNIVVDVPDTLQRVIRVFLLAPLAFVVWRQVKILIDVQIQGVRKPPAQILEGERADATGPTA